MARNNEGDDAYDGNLVPNHEDGAADEAEEDEIVALLRRLADTQRRRDKIDRLLDDLQEIFHHGVAPSADEDGVAAFTDDAVEEDAKVDALQRLERALTSEDEVHTAIGHNSNRMESLSRLMVSNQEALELHHRQLENHHRQLENNQAQPDQANGLDVMAEWHRELLEQFVDFQRDGQQLERIRLGLQTQQNRIEQEGRQLEGRMDRVQSQIQSACIEFAKEQLDRNRKRSAKATRRAQKSRAAKEMKATVAASSALQDCSNNPSSPPSRRTRDSTQASTRASIAKAKAKATNGGKKGKKDP